MARNGSGTYSRVTGTPYVYNTTIDQVVVNAEMDDIATALTNSLAKDGQTTPTANLPMGGFKLTGLAAGSGNGESVRYEQVGTLATTQGAAALAGATFTGPVLFDTVSDIASAATIDLTDYGSGAIATVTGTTATSAFTMSDGQTMTLVAAAAWPLTYHATTNKVMGGVSAVLAPGDMVKVSKTGGVVSSEIIKSSISCVRLHTHNGYGSVNTVIDRFATTAVNIGDGIIYADSATLGASFTILTSDVYAMSFSKNIAGAGTFGISRNSAQLTTNVGAINQADLLCGCTTAGAGYQGTAATKTYLEAGDVIRPHSDAQAVPASFPLATFSIARG